MLNCKQRFALSFLFFFLVIEGKGGGRENPEKKKKKKKEWGKKRVWNPNTADISINLASQQTDIFH